REPLLLRRSGHETAELAIEQIDDLGRRPGWRKHGGPRARLKSRSAGLGESRDVGKLAQAPRRRDAERTQASGLHQGEGGGAAVKERVAMTAHRIIERRPAAAIGHVRQVEVERMREHLCHELRWRADADIAEIEPSSFLPRPLDKVSQAL